MSPPEGPRAVMGIETDGHAQCLDAAARCLKEGGIVCYPTETFYALGVLYDNHQGLERLALLKGRPAGKAFPLIVGDFEMLVSVAVEIDELAQKLMASLWPGALTFVVRAREGLSPYVKDARETVAVRLPDSRFARHLSREVGRPVTATSANRAGASPARGVPVVRDHFPEGIDLIIDGGESRANLPSTIIEVRGGEVRLLREGAVPLSLILSLAG